MKNIDWNNVQEATGFERPGPGGYICGILSGEDEPSKEYIRCTYDIIEGDFKNYYRDRTARNPDWNLPSFIKSYKEKALGFFKHFITAVEASNAGFKFNNDETKLRGKQIGLVLGEEEYQKRDGTIGVRLAVTDFVSVNDIRKGNFTVPKLKKLAGSTGAATAPAADFEEITDDEDDLPF